MATPYSRSTSTFVLALLKRSPVEGLSDSALQEELLRYAGNPELTLDGVKYLPTIPRMVDRNLWFASHLRRQQEILTSLGLVVARDGYWSLPSSEARSTDDGEGRDRQGALSNDGSEEDGERGFGQVLAHPLLFCLSEADYFERIDNALETFQ